ncbi:MAG: exonuclease SbcCD subunit D [Eubacterium sp.]|nr:exonuclease SbcCD subunit D [Eubacterium sp.]
MRLLHTSDWHLGRMNSNRPMPEDQKFFIDAICDIVVSENISAVLIAGDIYDRSIASPDAIKLYDYAMKRIAGELGVKVLSIAGNHDSGVRLATNSELLKNSGLYISGALSESVECIELDDVQVFMFPWFTSDKVKALFSDDAQDIKSLTDAYEFIVNKAKEQFVDGKKHIALSHSFIVGAETSTSDRSAEVGFASAVSAKVFDGFDYVALGHIHKPQDVAPNIRYSGTPMPYAFGKEEDQVKSVTVINTDDMAVSQIPLPQLHLRKTLKATFDEFLKADYPDEIKNAYLRLEITDSYLGLEMIAMLSDIYPNAIEFCGKSYDDGDSNISLSVEELEKLESNPEEIFKQFCIEQIKSAPDEHKLELFKNAVEEYEKGVEET